MRLRTRIGALAGVGLVIFAIIAMAVGSQFAESRSAATELVTRLQLAATASDQLVLDVADVDRGLSNFVLTGEADDRASYAAAKFDSDQQLELLTTLLSAPSSIVSHAPDSPARSGDCAGTRLTAQLSDVAAARSAWVADVATPTITAMSAHRRGAALASYDTPAADERYRRVNAAATALQAGIAACKIEQVAEMTTLSNRLLAAVIISGALLLVGLGLAFGLIGSWVLHPVDSLRVQLRRVAGERDHEAPITPSGPPEIAALGRDAEQMRRELVAETDEARAAVEGLAQEGPTVSTIRAALDRANAADTGVADVYGQQHPAVGVLAGDWWDAVELGPRQLAIVLFDVSGHGPTAAVIGLKLKTLVMTALAGGSVRELNLPALAETFADTPASFATCLIVVLDRDADRVDWINAGHPAALLLRGDGSVETLDQTGPLLSTLGGQWSWRSLPLQSPARGDDVLLAWTDGLTERRAIDSATAEADFARANTDAGIATDVTTEASLVELVRRRMSTSTCDARELGEVVLSAVRHQATAWSRDDVTLVVARISDT